MTDSPLKKCRVLVVDDSGFVVAAISRKLSLDPNIEVVGSASNGIEALEKIKALRPDVVTLDVVMPEMDGLTALRHIMSECPTPVIMLSALTSENAEATIRALELGAVDFFLKPSAISPVGDGNMANSLAAKIKLIARTNRLLTHAVAPPAMRQGAGSAPAEKCTRAEKLVVIGCSTGGPGVLMRLIPALPADLPAAVLIVQHMPPMFTKSLADRLNQASNIRVKEAQAESDILQGQALMAPGNYHMLMGQNFRILLNQGPTVHGVRPSVDVTMKSVAQVFGSSTVGVILTGMGNDGTNGASLIKAAGGKILAQDESTCAVYGMPRSAVEAGIVEKVVPLGEMASEIVRACSQTKNR